MGDNLVEGVLAEIDRVLEVYEELKQEYIVSKREQLKQAEMWIDIARNHFHRWQTTDEGIQQLLDKYFLIPK